MDTGALRKLLEEGTPGPWGTEPSTPCPLDYGEIDDLDVTHLSKYGEVEGWVCADINPEDAILIAAAVNALPELLDAVEEARAVLECQVVDRKEHADWARKWGANG